MTRRTWTLLTSIVLVAALGLLGGLVRVPYVALGPGPTYNTLGSVSGTQVVSVKHQPTFPTSGHLNMTTVSLVNQLSLFDALGLWASGRYTLAPRDAYFPPNMSEKQVEQANTQAFNRSESSAETAALRHLGYPTKVVVGQVLPNSPADGIVAPGDTVLAVNGKPVSDPHAFLAAFITTHPGQQVNLSVQHGDGPPRTARVTLGQRPPDATGAGQNPEQGFLGVTPSERADAPFQVRISLADVGGPSAGLMFALSLLDKLTPGDLTGGQFVAGTGEISADGVVGPIGGIQHKMLAAREAGATTFLVPAQNCAEAKARTPDGLHLARVHTLDDALGALSNLRSGQPLPQC